MTWYVQSHNGAAIPCNPYSTEQERKEVEIFRNIERESAYKLRKAGQKQRVIFKVR